MPNEDSEPLIDSELEISIPAPGELASKILQLRAKGDAKNNPKKPKAPAGAPRPTRIIAPDSALDAATEKVAATDEAMEKAIGKDNETEVPSESLSEIAPHFHNRTAEVRPPGAAPSDGKLENLAANIEHLTELIASVGEQVSEQNSAHDKAFDLLYDEMSGYKNDFFYERLKPTLRALLFLLDSIEEFEREVEAQEQKGAALPGEILKANLAHFRDQLRDVLLMSEMAPIEASDEKFNAKTQRAVQVVTVEAAQNNTVQRQVRGGWTLGGKMLRPADVVVGKSDEIHKK
ncbi:GrpE protein [Abditibacterium utsteinense]|uniref:GrpE protein n=1 Tax=Abditibacterium utsteinense TaxID=1960156 RepID=A0A2S8SVE1_9BACT|nr:nucleotide exchange factor GrpE [Abditibacterium utsteinense]PQV64749.1 GrpE protein [Abditibacterium utsteinense]